MLWLLITLFLLYPIPAFAQSTSQNLQALVGGLIVRNPVYNNNSPNSLYFLTKTGGPQPDNTVAQIKTDIKTITSAGSGDFTSTLDILTKRLVGQGPNGTQNVYELKPSVSIDEFGSVYMGRIKQGPRGIPDFWWDNENYKLRTRGLMLHEIGDMPDFAIGRAGPDGAKWDEPIGALTKNTLIGKIYWWGTGPNKDFQCAPGSGIGEVAYINVRAAETFTDTSRPGSLLFATTPVGTCNPVERMVIKENGRIGIDTDNPQAQLHVQGNALASGTWGQVSDIRLKEDIQPLSDPLNKILGLRGISYLPINKDDPQRQLGLIAQEVEKVVPEVVSTGDDGYKSVSYQNLVPVLIEAMKEQQKQIEELKKELNSLKNLSP